VRRGPNGGRANGTITIKNPSGRVVKTITCTRVAVNVMPAAKLICKQPRGACGFMVHAKDVAVNAQASAARLHDLLPGPKCPDGGRTVDSKVTLLRLVTLVWRVLTAVVLTAALALGACGESDEDAPPATTSPAPSLRQSPP
jgi:hypothetical protein